MEQPDDFQWNRRGGDNLAFGAGAHECLGTAVGKMVGATLYRTLAARCESIWVSQGKDNPQFIPSLPILGVESVRMFAKPIQRTGPR